MRTETKNHAEIGRLLCDSFTASGWRRLVRAIEDGKVGGLLPDLHPDVLARLDTIGWRIEAEEGDRDG